MVDTHNYNRVFVAVDLSAEAPVVLVFVVDAGPSNTFPAWIKRACIIPPAASQSPFNFNPQSPEPGYWPRLALPAHAHCIATIHKSGAWVAAMRCRADGFNAKESR